MKDKVEHIIQNEHGQIGQRNSYGHNPRNLPGCCTNPPGTSGQG
jgi:hypothetical protein